jgi:hypothetical protein
VLPQNKSTPPKSKNQEIFVCKAAFCFTPFLFHSFVRKKCGRAWRLRSLLVCKIGMKNRMGWGG